MTWSGDEPGLWKCVRFHNAANLPQFRPGALAPLPFQICRPRSTAVLDRRRAHARQSLLFSEQKAPQSNAIFN
jgi:hypothetical protein